MSYSQYLQGRAIQTGCEWRLKIKINSSALEVFSASARFTAQIRRKASDETALATLTSAAGSISRVDGTSLELVLDGAITQNWSEGVVVMDIVRTDLTRKVHLGFDLEIPVKRSVTRV